MADENMMRTWLSGIEGGVPRLGGIHEMIA